MFQKLIIFLYECLFNVMSAIDQSIPPLYIKIPILYVFLLICWMVLLVFYDGLIIRGLSSGLEFLYEFFRANKSVSAIRVLSEWYYLFDKLLHLISPHVFSYKYPNENVLDKSNVFSPIVLYRTVVSFIISMFAFSIGNILIWGIVLLYFYPTLLQDVGTILVKLKWFEVLSSVTQIQYTKINDFLSFVSIILSIAVILWLTASTFKWKAMRKIKEEKYEKAIKYQENIEELLSIVFYNSMQNINRFNRMMKYLPDMFGQLITRTDKYFLVKGVLESHDSRQYSATSLDDLTRGYESFHEEINKINEILEDIRQSRLRYIFNQVNKSIHYEALILSLFYRTHLDSDLIERTKLEKTIEGRLKSLKQLTNKFSKIKEVRSGWLKKEDFENEYNMFGGSFTYERIEKYAEQELEKEMLEFKRFLHRELEEAIFHHIVLKEYLEISYRNTRFNLLRMIISFFGSK